MRSTFSMVIKQVYVPCSSVCQKGFTLISAVIPVYLFRALVRMAIGTACPVGPGRLVIYRADGNLLLVE